MPLGELAGYVDGGEEFVPEGFAQLV